MTRREEMSLLRLGDAQSGVCPGASRPPASCRPSAGTSSPQAGLDLRGDLPTQPTPKAKAPQPRDLVPTLLGL